MDDVNAKAVAVTGGAAGIGLATVQALARQGARVAILDRDVDKLDEARREAISKGAAAALALECDVRSEDSVTRSIDKAAAELGPLRGLVTSAGIDRGGLVHTLPLDQWDAVIGTNLTGTFLACKHVLRHMVAHGQGGAVVCVSSAWAEVSAPGGASAYCASKGGVSALVRSMALDYAAHGIRVNGIFPGATETELMWAGLHADAVPAMRRQISGQLAMGRLGRPDEIAAGIAWLLSSHASYVTGSHLTVDGGLMARGSVEC